MCFFQLIYNAKLYRKTLLPILIDTDYTEFNIEGYVQLDSNNLSINNSGELLIDQIENEEIIETNKEYSYYEKHFIGQVKDKYQTIKNICEKSNIE